MWYNCFHVALLQLAEPCAWLVQWTVSVRPCYYLKQGSKAPKSTVLVQLSGKAIREWFCGVSYQALEPVGFRESSNRTARCLTQEFEPCTGSFTKTLHMFGAFIEKCQSSTQ